MCFWCACNSVVLQDARHCGIHITFGALLRMLSAASVWHITLCSTWLHVWFKSQCFSLTSFNLYTRGSYPTICIMWRHEWHAKHNMCNVYHITQHLYHECATYRPCNRAVRPNTNVDMADKPNKPGEHLHAQTRWSSLLQSSLHLVTRLVPTTLIKLKCTDACISRHTFSGGWSIASRWLSLSNEHTDWITNTQLNEWLCHVDWAKISPQVQVHFRMQHGRILRNTG